jgi:hypothetical protein
MTIPQQQRLPGGRSNVSLAVAAATRRLPMVALLAIWNQYLNVHSMVQNFNGIFLLFNLLGVLISRLLVLMNTHGSHGPDAVGYVPSLSLHTYLSLSSIAASLFDFFSYASIISLF